MSAGVAQVHWPIYIGTKWTKSLTWYSDLAETSPVNLTGYTAQMDVRRGIGDTSALISLTQASGITLGGAAGTIVLTIEDSENTFAPGPAYFDLILNDGTDELPPLLGGVLDFIRTVSLQGGSDT